MDQFPHLNFVQKVSGKPRLFGGGDLDERSKENQNNRSQHSSFLDSKSNNLESEWNETLQKRAKKNLAPLSDDVVPVFLRIDPNLTGIGLDLHPLGIEIISEEDDGFILGASLDSLRSLKDKISDFAKSKSGSGLVAQLWDIRLGNREEWIPKRILSKELLDKWNQIDDRLVLPLITLFVKSPMFLKREDHEGSNAIELK